MDVVTALLNPNTDPDNVYGKGKSKSKSNAVLRSAVRNARYRRFYPEHLMLYLWSSRKAGRHDGRRVSWVDLRRETMIKRWQSLDGNKRFLGRPWIPLRKLPSSSPTQWSQKWKSGVLNLHILLSHEAALLKCASGREFFTMWRRDPVLIVEQSHAAQHVKSPTATLQSALRATPRVESIRSGRKPDSGLGAESPATSTRCRVNNGPTRR
jgi:hypothetical protein